VHWCRITWRGEGRPQNQLLCGGRRQRLTRQQRLGGCKYGDRILAIRFAITLVGCRFWDSHLKAQKAKMQVPPMAIGQLGSARVPIRQIVPPAVAIMAVVMGQIGISVVVVMPLVLIRERMRVPDRWRRNGSHYQQDGEQNTRRSCYPRVEHEASLPDHSSTFPAKSYESFLVCQGASAVLESVEMAGERRVWKGDVTAKARSWASTTCWWCRPNRATWLWSQQRRPPTANWGHFPPGPDSPGICEQILDLRLCHALVFPSPRTVDLNMTVDQTVQYLIRCGVERPLVQQCREKNENRRGTDVRNS